MDGENQCRRQATRYNVVTNTYLVFGCPKQGPGLFLHEKLLAHGLIDESGHFEGAHNVPIIVLLTSVMVTSNESRGLAR